MLLALPLAFVQKLDPRAVHQRRRGIGVVGLLHPLRLLAPAHGAEIGHSPVQSNHAQQTFNQAQTLTQSLAEQAFTRRQNRMTALEQASGWRPLCSLTVAFHSMSFVQPDGQRSTSLVRGCVHRPVASFGFIHMLRLSALRFGFERQSRFVAQLLALMNRVAG